MLRDLSQRPLARVVLTVVILDLFFGVAFYLAESERVVDPVTGQVTETLSITDGLWWAMVTMSTVGYGDISPSTAVGRYLVAYPCMLLGIGLLGYFVGVVADAIIDGADQRRRGLVEIRDRDHYVICNCPGVDRVLELLDELALYGNVNGRAVVVTDAFEQLPLALRDRGVGFVQGDPCRETVLRRANVTRSAGVFVLARDPLSPTSDEKTFAIGTILELMADDEDVDIHVTVELVSRENEAMMLRSGVDGIVTADGLTGPFLAQEFLFPGIHGVFQQLLSRQTGSQFYIRQTRLAGYPVEQLRRAVLEGHESLQVIGLVRDGRAILNPTKDEVIGHGDRLIVLADSRAELDPIERRVLGEPPEDPPPPPPPDDADGQAETSDRPSGKRRRRRRRRGRNRQQAG